MKTHFVILPGLSSPSFAKYVPVYQLLDREARVRGLQPELIHYPGQVLDNGQTRGECNLSAAVDHLLPLLDDFEARGEPYYLMAISFGCFVALATPLKLATRNGLKKAILWGPVPYWTLWRDFVHKLNPEFVYGTTLREPIKEWFLDLIPIEYLLSQADFAVHVCLGSADKYIPHEFIYYLERAIRTCGLPITFTIVEGCPHNVSEEPSQNYKGYTDAVFCGVDNVEE